MITSALLRCLAIVAFCALIAQAHPALGKRVSFDGPVRADVVRVIDGDTLDVRVRIWLDQTIRVLVRIRGIDAPERKAQCAHERHMARQAARHLESAVATGPVVLRNIGSGKYFGRVLADVSSANGAALSGVMLAAGLARPYRGRQRGSWCSLADM